MQSNTTWAQSSTRADFDAYAETQIGRWVGEITWITDWPGMGKKGDKVTGYWEGTMIADGNAVFGTFYGGTGSTTFLAIYDAGAKQIIETAVSSGGSVWKAIVTRKGDQFVSHAIGSNPDGGKIETTATLTISDGGKSVDGTAVGEINEKPSPLPSLLLDLESRYNNKYFRSESRLLALLAVSVLEIIKLEGNV